jgi:AAA domain-containing protein
MEQTLKQTETENPFTNRLPDNGQQNKKAASLLTTITRQKRRRPVFGVLYGPSGIGKSTFGASLPEPVFLQVERGLDMIRTPKFPVPRDFAGLYAQVDALDKEEHPYQSIVLDTLDATEVLIWQRVCQEGKCKSIEDFAGGYGKGYVRSRELMQGLMAKLSDMSERYHVLLLAHSHIKTISDPMLTAPYDMHRMKLQDKAAEIVRQSVDLILYVNLEENIVKDAPRARKGRNIVSGDRLMWTQPITGAEAKNRYDLDSPMEFSWDALYQGVQKFYDK